MSLASDGTRIVALVSGVQPTLWGSTDGQTWQLKQTLPAGVYANKVAAGPGGFVLAGQRQNDPSRAATPAAWRSPDGGTWNEIEPPASSAPWQGVAIGQDGTVVFAGNCPQASQADMTEAICTELLRDGTWTAVSSPVFTNGVFGDLAAGPGGFLMVGQVRGTDIPSSGAAWTSADGLSWSRITPDAWASLLFIGAAVTPHGLLAVGSSNPATGFVPVAFRSTDAQSWSALPAIPDVLGSGSMTGRLSAAGALGDGSLVVAGIGLASTSAGARQVPLLLILRASGQWEPVAEVGVPAEATPESLGSLELGSLVVAGDRIFVGGGDSEGAVIWTGAPET